MTDNRRPDDPNDPLTDNPSESADRDLRAAFGRLRAETQKVDTMNALRKLDDEGRRNWLGFPLLAAAAAAVLVIVGVVAFTGDDAGDTPNEVITADDGAVDGAVTDPSPTPEGDAQSTAVEPDPTAEPEATAEPEPPTTEPEPTEPAAPTYALALDGSGLQLVNAEDGSIQTLEFGVATSQEVTRALDTILGEPGVTTPSSPECPNGAADDIVYADAGLSLEIAGDSTLLAWSLRPESTLTTLTGIGIGSTRAELDTAYVPDYFESTLGFEFSVTGLGGILEGEGPEAVITILWGGGICAFR